MSRLQLHELKGVGELRAAAPAWDSLWRRSAAASPVAQAEGVAQWIDHFAVGRDSRALVVAKGDDLVAALPLVGQRKAGVPLWGGAPTNAWCASGELLFDPGSDAREVFGLLARGVGDLPWPLLRLDLVPTRAPCWQALLQALQTAGLACREQHSHEIGEIAIDDDWCDYEARWSGNHRRHMRKALKRAEREGGVRLHWHEELAPDEVEPLLRRGFEIEDRSWKGAAGSSVLRTPGLSEFYMQQAQWLASRGQLRIAMLELAGRDAAFLMANVSGRTLFTPKIGYDESFAEFSPGQLLWLLLLEQLHNAGQLERLNFAGQLGAATAKWATSSYAVSRVTIATRGILGRAALSAYDAIRPWLRRSDKNGECDTAPSLPGVRPAHLDVEPPEIPAAAM